MLKRLIPDPRERDFRRDFYQESAPVEVRLRRRQTGQMTKRRSTEERMKEMSFRLEEARQYMCLLSNELESARRLYINIRKERQAPPTPPTFTMRTDTWAKKARRTVVCKKCDTLGHHWLDCLSPLCSCGEWHSEHSKPRPTCTRINGTTTSTPSTGRPTQEHPVPVFGPSGMEGWLPAPASEGNVGTPPNPQNQSPTVRW